MCARVALSVVAIAVAACGSAGCIEGVTGLLFGATETYTVGTNNTWDIVSSNGSTGYISFGTSSTAVYFAGYNTGGAAVAGLTGFSQTLLKYPIRVDDAWSATGLSGGYTVSSTTVVADDAVQVTVPAGTFTCVETTETASVPSGYNNGAYVAEYKRYFAPGVGLVKVVNTWKNGSTTIGELQSYSVPNAAGGDYFPLNLGSSWTFRWSGR
jgi:hypothetical protein